jgi:hypothetical protein
MRQLLLSCTLALTFASAGLAAEVTYVLETPGVV